MGHYDNNIISDKELEKEEEEINKLHLENKIKIKNKIISTYGEIKKYITSEKMLERLNPYFSNHDSLCLYQWYMIKKYNN